MGGGGHNTSYAFYHATASPTTVAHCDLNRSLFFAGTPTIELLILSICMMWEFEKNQTVMNIKSFEKECAEALKDSIFHHKAKGRDHIPSTRLMKKPKAPPPDASGHGKPGKEERDRTPSWWSSRHSKKNTRSVPRASTTDDVTDHQELSTNDHIGISIDEPPPYPATRTTGE